MKSFKQYILERTTLPRGKKVVLQADDKEYDRGLIVQYKEDGSYDIEYWYNDPDEIVDVEAEVDGKSIKKDAKKVRLLYHPHLDHENDDDESFVCLRFKGKK